jgi:hypothetical protein
VAHLAAGRSRKVGQRRARARHVLRLGGDELRTALGGPIGIWLALD